MYYNKDMFDKYGIEIPTTMDELETAMQKFKDKWHHSALRRRGRIPTAAPVVAAGPAKGRQQVPEGLRDVRR